MKKFLLILLPVVLAIAVVGVLFAFFGKDVFGKGALQVTSVPQSNVFLNGKYIGKTPLCKCDGQNLLAVGDYTIRMVPVDNALSQDVFEQKITITKAILTVVDRTFGAGPNAQGSVISLTPGEKGKVGLSVVSFPDGALVSVDAAQIGTSPVAQVGLTESDHDILLQKSGYKDKHIRVHTVSGFTLSVIAYLAIDPQALATSSATLNQAQASSAASLSTQKIIILDTPTGFLRVRSDPSLGGSEIAQVKPGESYVLLAEQNGWYQIQLTDGKTTGWISASYAKKQ